MIYELKDMTEVQRYMLTLSSKDSYLFYHKTKYYESVVKELLSKTHGKWETAVRWFVTNTARGLKYKAHAMNVSMDSNFYARNTAKIGYRNVKALLDLLESKAYIHIYKGYVAEWEMKNGKLVAKWGYRSVIQYRKRYLELWEGLPVDSFKIGAELDLIGLTNRDTRDTISLKGKSGVKEMRQAMQTYNENLYNADITFNDKPISIVEYKREFLDTMEIAGRIYAAGGHVQLLPQKYRAEYLKIDGEKVVELDFSSIHPAICMQVLHNTGVDVLAAVGKDFKPYAANLDFVQVDWMLIEQHKAKFGLNSYDPLRSIAKLALLIGMNSVDLDSAVGALSHKLFLDHKKDEKDKQFVGLVSKVPVQAILLAVQEYNYLIEDFFFKDYGVQLQNIDSKIASYIVSSLVELGITVLSYHDSFVTAQKHEDVLRKVMYKAWEYVLQDSTFCKVDKK